MLQIMRRGQRWIMWFVIVVVGGAFVFFLGGGGGLGPGGAPQYVAVEVDGRRYSSTKRRRARSCAARFWLGRPSGWASS
jgi:hypothetical protein